MRGRAGQGRGGGGVIRTGCVRWSGGRVCWSGIRGARSGLQDQPQCVVPVGRLLCRGPATGGGLLCPVLRTGATCRSAASGPNVCATLHPRFTLSSRSQAHQPIRTERCPCACQSSTVAGFADSRAARPRVYCRRRDDGWALRWKKIYRLTRRVCFSHNND